MNCDAIHRCLLALDRLDEMPSDVRKHLDACNGCRTMHEQLTLIEAQVPHLPVPPTTRKAAFLDYLMRPLVSVAPIAPIVPAPPPETKTSLFNLTTLFRPTSDGQREKKLRKVAIAVAMAASLLIAVFGIWMWNHSGTIPSPADKPNYNWLADQKTRDVRWRDAKTSADRVRLYDELAIEVEKKTLALRNATEMATQLDRFKEVIENITTQEARGMTKEERAQVLLPIATRLAMKESEARQLAMEFPELADKLNEFAMAAAEGDRRIRGLL